MSPFKERILLRLIGHVCQPAGDTVGRFSYDELWEIHQSGRAVPMSYIEAQAMQTVVAQRQRESRGRYRNEP